MKLALAIIAAPATHASDTRPKFRWATQPDGLLGPVRLIPCT
jgi:hypothetical protein